MGTHQASGRLGRRERDRTVKRVLGSALEPLGFRLGDTSRDTWRYERVKGGYRRFADPSSDEVRQFIDVGETAFVVPERFVPALDVRFSTDARVNYTSEDMYRATLKRNRLFPEAIGAIAYEGREGLEEALGLVVRIVEEYGLERLEELSAESEEVVTRAMWEEFSLRHGELADRFEERYLAGLPARPSTPQEVLETMRGVEAALSEAEAVPYERAKPLLVSIASFLLRAACEVAGAQAVFRDDGMFACLRHERRSQLAERCFRPLSETVRAWLGRLEDVPEYTSLLLRATSIDPERPREELSLDLDEAVRSTIGATLEEMGFAFEGNRRHRGLPSPQESVWLYARRIGGTFHKIVHKPGLRPSRLVTVQQASLYAQVVYNPSSGTLGLDFASDVHPDSMAMPACEALDHALRRVYPDYLGDGSFYTYDDGSFREAAEKIARMAPELEEVRLKLVCPRVGEYLAPEWLVEEGEGPS